MNLIHEVRQLLLNMEINGDQLIKYLLTQYVEGKKTISYVDFCKDIKKYKKLKDFNKR